MNRRRRPQTLMRFMPIVIIAAMIAVIAITVYLVSPAPWRAPARVVPAAPATSLTTEQGKFLFNVSLHTPEEIAGMLTRAEQLSKTLRPQGLGTGIALVLHGPEIEVFARNNYARFRATVDRAARLDAGHIVDVKVCRTEMKLRGIREQDLPDFIEVVPYGPDEEARLRRDGYVYF